MTHFKTTTLTFPLQEEAEQGRCHGDCFMVVVIVVDRQQVPMNIGITHKQVDVRDPMHMLQQAIELIKASRLGPVQREPPEFCSKLITWNRHQYT